MAIEDIDPDRSLGRGGLKIRSFACPNTPSLRSVTFEMLGRIRDQNDRSVTSSITGLDGKRFNSAHVLAQGRVVEDTKGISGISS